MADVTVDPTNTDPKSLLGQGIRAYVLQDYDAAVTALSKSSELLVSQHGDDLHDSLGDVYLYYGKALLGLAREQSEPLGDAVPKGEEEDGEEDEGIEDGEGKEEDDEKMNEEGEGDKVNGDEKMEEGVANEDAGDEKEAGPSGSGSGDAEETTEDKEADDEPTDLQLAWEVLELAKKIYTKHGDDGKKNLAETLVVLGEVSLESENFESAVNDIREGLEIQKALFGNDSRTVAETCYKLGMAYSITSRMDEAIKSFEQSLETLKNRINVLEKIEDKKDEHTEEITEIKNLIPDIEEKINDVKNEKEEAIKKIAEKISQPLNQPTSNGASSSSSQVNNISHLVKRKRKLEEGSEEKAEEDATAAKKPAT